MRLVAAIISVIVLGVLCGAMVFIAFAIIPYWQSLPPTVFQQWFQQNVHLFGELMIPLAQASTVCAVLSVFVYWKNKEGRYLALIAVASVIGIFVIYQFVHSPTNALLLGASRPETELKQLLERWVCWHWVRTSLGLAAFTSLTIALRLPSTGKRNG